MGVRLAGGPAALVVPGARATADATIMSGPLRLPAPVFRILLERQGPSLGLWRAAEVAALREHGYHRPVLDFGCGDGLVGSQVLRRIDIGVDPNAAALERARPLGVYRRLEAEPIERVDLPPASVATVVSNSVVEHLERPEEALAAVARLLERGGRFICTTPTPAFSGSLLLGYPGYVDRRNHGLEHRNLWPAERWGDLLESVGLRVEAVRPYLRPGLVRAWDALELTQQVWIGRRRAVGLIWRRVPASGFAWLAERAARLDLSAPPPGGGQLIVARKV
ncbi:MAG TPA: class I SAM-dependent methyltransferase [Thermomicrobiaceae bacterium]|nr:class I SAM-dependent methyltransferase [Thermomicrobiaceae bacterium]